MSDPADDLARERAHNFQTRFEGDAPAYGYKGIPIFAAPGLHEYAAERLAAALPPAPGVRVLELGAGGGAMSLRLADHGYAVTASDLFEDNFTPRGAIPFHALDLNQPFAARVEGRFDAVVALELVEHLENPHQFLRECRQLLAPGGWLLLSTPNIANPMSQAMFLRHGHHQWFSDDDYRAQGHITPLAPIVLRRAAAEAGLACEWEGSVSDPQRMHGGRRNRRMRWLARLLAACSTLPPTLRGEVYVALFRAPAG